MKQLANVKNQVPLDHDGQGVIEIPHEGERLAMVRCGKVPIRVGSESSTSVGGSLVGTPRSQRPRSRDPKVKKCLHGVSDTQKRAEQSCRGRSDGYAGRRTALSPAPVCNWGTRYAARFRVCSLRQTEGPIKSGPCEEEVCQRRREQRLDETTENRSSVINTHQDVKHSAPMLLCDDLTATVGKGLNWFLVERLRLLFVKNSRRSVLERSCMPVFKLS